MRLTYPSKTLGTILFKKNKDNMCPTRKHQGFPSGTSGKELACQCKRHKRYKFNPWVRKIHWSRKWQPTPIFLSKESHE